MIWVILSTLYSPLTEAQKKELWLSLHPYAVVERAITQYWIALVFAAFFCFVTIRRAQRKNATTHSYPSRSSDWLLVPFLFWGLRVAVYPLRSQYTDVLYYLNALLPAMAALFLVLLLLGSTTFLVHMVYEVDGRCTYSQALAITAIVSAVLIDNTFYFVILYDLGR